MTNAVTDQVNKISANIGSILVVLTFGSAMFTCGIFFASLRADVTKNTENLNAVVKTLEAINASLDSPAERFSRADAQNQYNRSRDNYDAGKQFFLAAP